MTGLRVAAIHLLAATLLACPYVCLSNVAAVAGTSPVHNQRSGGCHCCSRPQSEDSQQCPSQSDSRQGSGTCLCHGAVMDRHVQTPDLNPSLVTPLRPDAAVFVRPSPAVERGFLTEQAACHFPAADCGRELRALIASLLL